MSDVNAAAAPPADAGTLATSATGAAPPQPWYQGKADAGEGEAALMVSLT